jgi:alkanesulfonate monooxygenase SsuD/methylene tetrahydromethanopterin reductase-like flavin-dependent oxidoreductase (luciferase family)
VLVELLFWEGCPSYPQALEQLRAALAEAGGDPASIVVREVHDEAQAAAERFPGSPTIRVDGRDVVGEGGSDSPPALTCRVYRLRDGRFSPTPDPEDLRDALRPA